MAPIASSPSTASLISVHDTTPARRIFVNIDVPKPDPNQRGKRGSRSQTHSPSRSRQTTHNQHQNQQQNNQQHGQHNLRNQVMPEKTSLWAHMVNYWIEFINWIKRILGFVEKPQEPIRYPGNQIKTSKYTTWTFIPKNLSEQYRRAANWFFTIITVLQFIPDFKTIDPFVAALPFVVVLLATAVKDGFEDWKRHTSDNSINQQKCLTLGNWQNVNSHLMEKNNRIQKQVVRRASTALLPVIDATKKFFATNLKLGSSNNSNGSNEEKNADSAGSTVTKTEEIAATAPTGDASKVDGNPSIVVSKEKLDKDTKQLFKYNQLPSPDPDTLAVAPAARTSSISSTDSGINSSGGAAAAAAAAAAAGRQRTHPEHYWKDTYWEEIMVGDIVLLRNNEAIPADMVLLSTSEPDCMCYVETKNLDGETNLKIRRGVMETSWIKTPSDCAEVKLYIDSEKPNVNLYTYTGTIIIPPTPSALKAIQAAMKSRGDLAGSQTLDTLSSSGFRSHSAPPNRDLVPGDLLAKPPRPVDGSDGGVTSVESIPTMTGNTYITDMLSQALPNVHVRPGISSAGAIGSTDTMNSAIVGGLPRAHSETLSERVNTATYPLNSEGQLIEELPEMKLRIPLNINGLLLRGCIIRNTDWIIGIVAYTGKDTKVILNSGDTPSKASKIDKEANPQVLINLLLLLILCIVCTIGSPLWEASQSDPGIPYISQEQKRDSGFAAFIAFWNAVIALQNIVPISFYISIEIVKGIQALFIHFDQDMYYEPMDRRCLARTYNLSDDLGRIEYVFSDKTGTLTRNVMEFKKCSVGGLVYKSEKEAVGENIMPLSPYSISIRAPSFRQSMSPSNEAHSVASPKVSSAVNIHVTDTTPDYDNPFLKDLEKVSFFNKAIIGHMQANDDAAVLLREFFRVLSVCHSVLIERPVPDNQFLLTYKAQSPDEAALVDAARSSGFVFLRRDQNNVFIDAFGKEEKFQLLNVIEFNSTRKRMSVIVRRPEGDIVLYCKGADSVIFERLADGQQVMKDVTSQHLESFAKEGLRTLCISYAIIPEHEYQNWAREFNEVSLSITDRDNKMDYVAEKIEKNLILVGATAIEDKLQEGVPECIAILAKAGIKIWVLTGDKMETAINIGYSCNLLMEDMNLIVIKGSGYNEADATTRQLFNAIEQFFPNDKRERSQENWVTEEEQADPEYQRHALIIDGGCLKYALEDNNKDLLLKLASECAAVICCRVSPLQKAKVVELVKERKKVMCLAIGDGANDVSMIQAAHVGVGIAGEEGLQAVMASDYAFAQFRYLSKLLLVHGRWSYKRNAGLILNFFFKNIIWTLPLFWYQFYCGFTNAYLFDYWWLVLFNTIFTALPVLSYGIWDRDIEEYYAFVFPGTYKEGIAGTSFTLKLFFVYMLDGIYQSFICFYIPFGVYYEASTFDLGYSVDLVHFGAASAIAAILNANIAVAVDTHSWNVAQLWFVFGPCVLVFIWILISTGAVAMDVAPQSFGLYIEIFGNSNFWLCIILATCICVLPRVTIKYVLQQERPTDTNIVQEVQKFRLPITDIGYFPDGKAQQHISSIDRRKSLTSTKSEMMITMMRTGETQVNRGFAFSQDSGTRDILMGREWRRIKNLGPELKKMSMSRLFKRIATNSARLQSGLAGSMSSMAGGLGLNFGMTGSGGTAAGGANPAGGSGSVAATTAIATGSASTAIVDGGNNTLGAGSGSSSRTTSSSLKPISLTIPDAGSSKLAKRLERVEEDADANASGTAIPKLTTSSPPANTERTTSSSSMSSTKIKFDESTSPRKKHRNKNKQSQSSRPTSPSSSLPPSSPTSPSSLPPTIPSSAPEPDAPIADAAKNV